MQRLLPILLPILLFNVLPLSSQVIGEKDFVDYYQQGEAALAKKDAELALRQFKRALKAKPNYSPALRGKGICHVLMRDYQKAAEAYEAALASDSLFSRALYYETGEALYKAGQPAKALTYFQRFQALQGKSFSVNTDREAMAERKYLKKLPSNIRACQVSLDSTKFINITSVENLGNTINTKADDYFPFVSNNQTHLMFTRKTDNGDEDLYESHLTDGRWRRATAVKALNSRKDEGMSTFVRDGRLLYFTVCGREGVLGACDIWQARLDEKRKVTDISPLEGFANSKNWESQASISCDGSTLYFSSKRDGGLGGTDLWYSQRQSDGSWGDPVNLGSRVNTELDEEAPFVTNDGQTLYFSSNGHPGLGDQDIFMSWLDEEEEWTAPINLGPPVNSAFRELGFFLTADGQTGYFSSDRTAEGRGGLDIYRFQLDTQLYSQPITFVEGLVIDSTLDSPVSATVQFADRVDITVGKDGRFFLCIPAGDTLDLQVEKKYFKPYRNKFIIPRWDNKQFYTIELLLRSTFDFSVPEAESTKDTLLEASPVVKRRKVVEHSHTIYFGFDDSEISYTERQKLLAFLDPLKGKQIEEVRIIGFSDEIGTDIYNIDLSTDRAKAVTLIIKREGPKVKEILMEARGEVKDESPREEKRRVEIKVKAIEE
jgi:outer membrane protein OmpA-like peptidoglycan-associated protein/tetratricopeptide (TPR) repeat protein